MFYRDRTGKEPNKSHSGWAKRALLFIATNIAVIAVLSVTMQLLGIDQFIAAQGGSALGLLVFAGVFGFGGAFISLAISKWMAKRAMGVQIITTPKDTTEQWLVDTVRRQAAEAGIGMPEVGIFYSNDPNAFATGANRDNALVAVSTGLLDRLSKQEVEAVLPQLVHDRENGFKGVDYAKLTGLLIEAIKEQQKQIDELKSKLQ